MQAKIEISSERKYTRAKIEIPRQIQSWVSVGRRCGFTGGVVLHLDNWDSYCLTTTLPVAVLHVIITRRERVILFTTTSYVQIGRIYHQWRVILFTTLSYIQIGRTQHQKAE